MLRYGRITMTKVLPYPIITWTVSILLAPICIHGAVPAELFVCKQDVCNRNGNYQFCSEVYGHCRDCKDILDECGKYTQPINCTRFCIGYFVDVKVKSLRETECPVLENVPNGAHSGSVRHRYGDVVDITCNDGFKLTSTGTITCREFGRWSHDLPSCKELECPVLGTVENGKHNGTNIYLYGDVVGITCNDGFEPTSTETVNCNEFGRWSHDLPSCKDAGVSWKMLFSVFVPFQGVLILGLVISCFLLKIQNVNKVPKDDGKDETQQKLINNEDNQRHSAMDNQSITVEYEIGANLGADLIPPRPRYIDVTQIVPNNPASIDNQAEPHDGTISPTEVQNGLGLKHPVRSSVSKGESIASFDTAETIDDGGELASDSGITEMKKTTKKEDNQRITLYITNVIGDSNRTTTGNQNNVDATSQTKQKQRRRSPNRDKSPKKPENEAVDVTSAQETGETKLARQPESSSSDENSPVCARKSRIDQEKADELRPEANIVCTPDDTSEKAHVVIGRQDIPLNELNQRIVTGQA